MGNDWRDDRDMLPALRDRRFLIHFLTDFVVKKGAGRTEMKFLQDVGYWSLSATSNTTTNSYETIHNLSS